MTDVFRIPLSNIPQTFSIDINGVEYIMRCQYNTFIHTWCIDIEYGGQTLIACLPLVTGVDLLSQHKHLGIDVQLRVATDGNEYETPTLESLGNESNLFYTVN